MTVELIFCLCKVIIFGCNNTNVTEYDHVLSASSIFSVLLYVLDYIYIHCGHIKGMESTHSYN